jgi:poly(3-hydroxybutyrate) depolymerase
MNYEADFRSISDTAGFILVPSSTWRSKWWQFNKFVTKEPTNHNDILFVETLLDTISASYNIDMDRVYT